MQFGQLLRSFYDGVVLVWRGPLPYMVVMKGRYTREVGNSNTISNQAASYNMFAQLKMRDARDIFRRLSPRDLVLPGGAPRRRAALHNMKGLLGDEQCSDFIVYINYRHAWLFVDDWHVSHHWRQKSGTTSCMAYAQSARCILFCSSPV